jgi:hypothetical protein
MERVLFQKYWHYMMLHAAATILLLVSYSVFSRAPRTLFSPNLTRKVGVHVLRQDFWTCAAQLQLPIANSYRSTNI